VRIGIMLRHYDQHGGGVRVYTQRLLQAMLELLDPYGIRELARTGRVALARGGKGITDKPLRVARPA